MPMYCVTCDQIEDWLINFKEKKNPEDLVIVDNPKLYLSCRVGDSIDEAYACYGDENAEVIESSGDVFNIAEINCASTTSPNFEIQSMIECLTNIRRQLPANSPKAETYLHSNMMLRQLDERRHELDLRQWTERINNLPGAQDKDIQDTLKLANDLHELWTNQLSN